MLMPRVTIVISPLLLLVPITKNGRPRSRNVAVVRPTFTCPSVLLAP